MKIIKVVGVTLGIGVGLYLLFVILLVLGPEISNYSNRTEFNSGKWKNWKESEMEMSLRWHMIHDLQGDYKLQGMTVNEIIDLLGEPDTKNNVEWTYYLGSTRHGIDTGTLSLSFEDGKVKSFKTYSG